MKKHLILVFLLSSLISISSAQEDVIAGKKNIPLVLSFFKHNASLPFEGIIKSPLHPGVSAGTEFTYKTGKIGKIFQTINIGYFYNKFNAKALFLCSEFGYRKTMQLGLFGDLFIGLGYIHSFHPKEIYALNAHGEYEKAKDKGKSAYLISAAIGLGYDFSKKAGWPFSVFIKYQYALQGPHNLDSPLWPNAMLHFGVRIIF